MSYGGGPPQPPHPGQDPYAMNYGGQPSYPSYPQQPTPAGHPAMPAYPPGPATGGYPPPSDAQPGQAPGYPPQPGMGGFPQAPHGYPQGYPAQPPAPGYPAQPPSGYPAQMGAPGYPAQPPSGYPAQVGASGYPAQPSSGYPAQPPAPGYPAQPPSGYPAQAGASGYPAQPPASGYPAQMGASGYPAQPPAPGYPAQPSASGYPAQGPAPGYPAQPPGSGYPQAPATGYTPGYPQAPPPTGGYGQPPPGQSVPGASPYGATPMAPAAGTTTHGTVVPVQPFDSEADAQVLRAAMKGFGTDEKAIINIISKRNNSQRIEIKTKFKVLFGKDLVRDLKSELSGNLEGCVVALFDPTIDYLCRCLRGAMKGLGTDEEALIEILTTSSNEQIAELKARYKALFSRNLENDLMSETSGHFKRLLVSLCQGARETTTAVDMAKAEKEARDLHDAGEKRWGTDESKFNQVLALRSFPQLRATFEAYSKLASRDILNSIDREMSGDLKMGMKAVIRVVQCPPSFFAERLYRSMKGAGTDDEALIRIVVSRCEVDMVEIKNEFMKMYKKSLSTMIKGDTSGDYKRLLIALVGED